MIDVKSLIESPVDGDRVLACEELWRQANGLARSPELIEILLRDRCAGVRWRTIEIIRATKYFSRDVVRWLKNSLLDDDCYVRHHARSVLRALGDDESVLLSVDRLLSCDHEAERFDAISEILSRDSVSEATQLVLARRLREECDASIRQMIATALCGALSLRAETIDALTEALTADDRYLRVLAATALQAGEQDGDRLVDVLYEGMSDTRCGPLACCTLYDMLRAQPRKRDGLFLQLRSEYITRNIGEIIARGVLPTIGIKIWNKGCRIFIPAHREEGETKSPWDDIGVYHSWKSHRGCGIKDDSSLTGNQICIHGGWFPDLHYIGVCQIARFVNNWQPEIAPIEIENTGAASIIESGGTLYAVRGMRKFPNKRTNRIDFLFGPIKDARNIQYLMFGGLCAESSQSSECDLDRLAAESWRMFRDSVERTLRQYDLSALAHEQWYTRRGRRSIRYRIRYERQYRELSPSLEELACLLVTPKGESLRAELRSIETAAVNKIEGAVNSHFYASASTLSKEFLADVMTGAST